MNLMDTVSTVRLYRIIADQIAAKIDSGEFAVGERLPAERLLAEQLGVSRASVREALIALELEGYVDVRVGAGVYVLDYRLHFATQGPRAVSPSAVAPEIGPFDLLETRLLLEPESAARAAALASATQLAEIELAHARMSAGPSHREHDRSFHLAIAQATGNAALESAIAHLWELSVNNRVFSRLDEHFVDGRDWHIAEVEHLRILQALLDRDASRARGAMQAHLTNILVRLHREFDQNAPGQRTEGGAA